MRAESAANYGTHARTIASPNFVCHYRDDIIQLITKRAGLENFVDKLGACMKHPSYSRAHQKPQLKFKKADDLILDFEFCKLVKSLEHDIIRTVQSKPGDLTNGPESNMTADQHSLILQYKNLIRDQDLELQKLRSDVYSYSVHYAQQHTDLQELHSTCQQLRDQNSLLKAQKAAASEQHEQASQPHNYSAPIASYVEEGIAPQLLDDFRRRNEDLQRQLDEANIALYNLVSKFACTRMAV